MTVTWDGVLRSQQQRAERAALRLPKLPSGTFVSFRPDGEETAAGTHPTPAAGTGSHHPPRGEQS